MPALPPDQPTSSAQAGDGVGRTVDQARGGQRTGRIIWVLVIGLVLVTVALMGIWMLRAPGLADTSKNGNERSADVSSFQAPQPSPKQAPPDMPSTTGQTTPDASSNAAH